MIDNTSESKKRTNASRILCRFPTQVSYLQHGRVLFTDGQETSPVDSGAPVRALYVPICKDELPQISAKECELCSIPISGQGMMRDDEKPLSIEKTRGLYKLDQQGSGMAEKLLSGTTCNACVDGSLLF